MEVVVASDPSAWEHDTGPHHPERPERLDAVLAGVVDSDLDRVEIEAPEIEPGELTLVHDPAYVAAIAQFCSLGGGHLDLDTVVSETSWRSALTAAGAVKASLAELESRSDATALALTRPPGHHALPNRAMGFCIFNNVAISAALLRARGQRVAILDWDVHHGNGTQAMLLADPDALYVSIHQSSFYPFEGAVSDIERDAKGTTVNVPLPAGSAGDVFRKAWAELVIPVVKSFDPDWVLVSAGFDAHANDPLAEFRLVDADYGWAANRLSRVHPPNRTVLVLEGGYDLAALRQSTKAALLGLSGVDEFGDPLQSPEGSFEALERAAVGVSTHWSL